MKFNVVEFDNSRHRDQVISLWKEAFGYKDARNDPGLVIDKKLAADDGLFFVISDGRKVVGTVMAGYDGHRGWIYSLAVSPGCRRQGLGGRLMSHAEEKLTARGCIKINLQILESNEAVKGFYLAKGYRVEPRISMGKQMTEAIGNAG